MASGDLSALSDSVLDLLAAAGLAPGPVELRRSWFPSSNLSDDLATGAQIISVVPSGRIVTNLSRVTREYVYEVAVVIDRKVVSPDDTSADSVNALVESVIEALSQKKNSVLRSAGGRRFSFERIENDPAFVPEMMDTHNVFRSVANAMYKLFKG